MYNYRCEVCSFECEHFNKIDDRHNGRIHCGKQMKLDVTGPMIHADLEPYFDDDLGTYVKSRQHHKQVMRENEVADKRDYRGQRWKN